MRANRRSESWANRTGSRVGFRLCADRGHGQARATSSAGTDRSVSDASARASLASPISTMAASSSETTPDRGRMLNTPWPPARRSTSSPSEWARTERLPDEHQLGGGEVRTEVAAEALDRPPGLLQFETGVEEPLDDLELEDVPVGVAALAPAAGGVGDRRAQQVGPGPVVELPIGDADEGTDLRPPEPLLHRELPRDEPFARPCLILHLSHSLTVNRNLRVSRFNRITRP